jgi:hypothetical protein
MKQNTGAIMNHTPPRARVTEVARLLQVRDAKTLLVAFERKHGACKLSPPPRCWYGEAAEFFPSSSTGQCKTIHIKGARRRECFFLLLK